jgi:hypothetical protein
MFCLSAVDVTTDTIWNDMLPYFERFAEMTGEIAPEQIRKGAADSNMQVWGLQDAEAVHAIAVTEVSETPRGSICTVRVACGGAPKPMQERLLDAIGAWAREIGCVTVRITGRRGWLRRFPRFKQTAVVMEWTL